MADPLVDRLRAAFRVLLGECLPNYKYLGFYRYAVTACDFDKQTFDGQPSVSSYGLPAVSKVPIRSPWKVELKPGVSVVLGFEGADPAAPFLAFADQLTVMSKASLRADGAIQLGENASLPIARQGDMVLTPALGNLIMFAALPTGDPFPSPMMTMTPYNLSVCPVTAVPPVPTFPATSSLPGFVSSGSVFAKTT